MPHVRVTEKTVYTFDELSEQAKDKAREWMSNCEMEMFDPDCTLDDASEIAEILGIELATKQVQTMGGTFFSKPKIWYSGFSSQGDGVSFEGRYRYAKGSKQKIRAHAPQDRELHRIADELARLQNKCFYKAVVDIGTSGNYSHSWSMRFEDVSDLTIKQQSKDDFDSMCQLLRDFADWIYSQLENEWEYRLSKESLDEMIHANEYEFTEDGRIA